MHPFASQWNLDSELYPLVGDLLEGREVVLDVGCGDGTLARYLARRGHQVLGIDREPEVLPSDSEGTHFELADASNLPFGLIPLMRRWRCRVCTTTRVRGWCWARCGVC